MSDRQITDVSDLTRHDLTQTRNQVYNLADNGHVSHHFASILIMLINAQIGRLQGITAQITPDEALAAMSIHRTIAQNKLPQGHASHRGS